MLRIYRITLSAHGDDFDCTACRRTEVLIGESDGHSNNRFDIDPFTYWRFTGLEIFYRQSLHNLDPEAQIGFLPLARGSLHNLPANQRFVL